MGDSGWPFESKPAGGLFALVEPVETKPFTILVVCTGNICRSPVGEQLLAAKFAAAGLPVEVRSAGTRALVGYDMTPEAAGLTQRFGGDPAGHAARQLTAELVEGADLIVTATREHRSGAVTLLPRASRRTFTLTQLARLVAALDDPISADAGSVPLLLVEPARPLVEPALPLVEPALPLVEPALPLVEPVETRLRAYVAELAASRGSTPPPLNADDDDIVDPYRRSQEIYDEVGQIIDLAATTVTAGFARAVAKA